MVVEPSAAAADGDHPRCDEWRRRNADQHARPLRSGGADDDTDRIRGADDGRCGRWRHRCDRCAAHQQTPRERAIPLADARQRGDPSGDHRYAVGVADGLRGFLGGDDGRHDLECDHGLVAPIDHSGSSARTGQQRLPLLCLGHDADRHSDRRSDRDRRRAVEGTRDCAPGSMDRRRRHRCATRHLRDPPTDDVEDGCSQSRRTPHTAQTMPPS